MIVLQTFMLPRGYVMEAFFIMKYEFLLLNFKNVIRRLKNSANKRYRIVKLTKRYIKSIEGLCSLSQVPGPSFTLQCTLVWADRGGV